MNAVQLRVVSAHPSLICGVFVFFLRNWYYYGHRVSSMYDRILNIRTHWSRNFDIFEDYAVTYNRLWVKNGIMYCIRLDL